jgi:hypothetical protein
MKLFTVSEANELIQVVRPRLERLKKLYARLGTMSDDARAAAAASGSGGGMPGGAIYIETLYEIGKIIAEISDQGIQLKDHTRGLIDFPSMREGRIVLLCGQLGEPDELEWWHETEAGFAGRQPL